MISHVSGSVGFAIRSVVWAVALFGFATAAAGAAEMDASVIAQYMKVGCDPEWIPAFGGGRGVNTGNPDDYVRAVTVFDDGSGSGPALYVAGGFTRVGAMTVYHIAKWDGKTWSALGSGTNGPLWSLAVFDEGTGPVLCAGGTALWPPFKNKFPYSQGGNSDVTLALDKVAAG
jgi:hypothetical protein